MASAASVMTRRRALLQSVASPSPTVTSPSPAPLASPSPALSSFTPSPYPAPAPIPAPVTTASGGTTVYTAATPVTYMSDYAVEAPDPSFFDTAAPSPPTSNTTNTTITNTTTSTTISSSTTVVAGPGVTPGMGPDLGNPVQDNLTMEAGVTTFRGSFDSVQGSYSIQFTPSMAITYTAVLSLRHPNLTSSFVVRRFHLAVIPNPALFTPAAAVNTTANTSTATLASVALFNPPSNSKFDFVATFNKLSATTYPGGNSTALDTFKAVVAANAVLSGTNWVIASITAVTPLRLNCTVSVFVINLQDTASSA
eukprot:GHUV01036508.1.p1 GENE.GHUV01036508.1~~GHUV01036508.1.p1  ORF type:complete len:310 (+),score=49.62 GHUV01036508.1:201-1130(+)